MNESLTLSEFQSRLGNAIHNNDSTRNVWVTAEFSDLRVSGGHCYMELVEKDDSGMLRAKLRGMIWRGTLDQLRRKFYAVTGRDISNGIKVMVKGSASHHSLYGLSFTISDIDPSYTLGDMERLRREILMKLTKEGLINLNKSLQVPVAPQRIAVISSEGAAGYGDFMNQIVNNQERIIVYTGLFPAVMQGDKTVPTVLDALDKVELTKDLWDAVAIIRGGGATTDLNSFDNYELAARIAAFPLPVIVGIGHERDRTVLDEVACIRCKTPTAVAEYIIGALRDAYGIAAELMRRITRYGTEALKGEHLRISNMARNILVLATNKIMRQKMILSEATSKLRLKSESRISIEKNSLDKIKLRIENGSRRIIQDNSQKLKSIDDLLRVLRPENTLKRGYSITRINGKAIKDASSLKAGDIIETTLSNGKLTSRIEK